MPSLVTAKQIEAQVDRSLRKWAKFCEDAYPQAQSALTALQDLAVGAWVERTVHEKGQAVTRRVYQRPPEIAAVVAFLKFAIPDPGEISNMMLAFERAQTTRTQKTLMGTQKLLAGANARKANREAEAFDKSIIDADMMEEAVSHVALSAIAFLQSLAVDEFPTTQEGKDAFIGRVERVVTEAVEEAMSVLPEAEEKPAPKRRGRSKKALPGGDDADDNESL